MAAVEGSLRRLGTDRIDLHILHEPDPVTPVEETLGALDDLVHAGKVRYIACSEFAAWQLCEALWTSRTEHLASFISVGAHYNVLDRGHDELRACARAYGVGLVPTAPLAAGFLTRKYELGLAPAADTRSRCRELRLLVARLPRTRGANLRKADEVQGPRQHAGRAGLPEFGQRSAARHADAVGAATKAALSRDATPEGGGGATAVELPAAASRPIPRATLTRGIAACPPHNTAVPSRIASSDCVRTTRESGRGPNGNRHSPLTTGAESVLIPRSPAGC